MKEYASFNLETEIDKNELDKIIIEAKNGNEEAFEKLCRFVYGRIYSYVFYRVKHKEDAEDLTSEVVLKIVRALKNQKGNFLAWIYKIAANSLIDFYRHRKVAQEISYDDLSQESIGSKGVSPNDVLMHDKLKDALTHLTKEQADVITFRFIQELDNEEIAKIMGKSIGSVKVLQFRALRSLREYFKKKGYETKD